jgi:hypothetical protein
MPFCPECRTEYRAGFDRCSDCGTALADVLPPEGHAAPPYELLLSTADPDLLPVVTSTLDAAGIPWVAEGAEAAALLPLGVGRGSSHGVAAEIHVPADRLEEARALLEAEAEPAGELPPELAEED